MTVKPTGRGGGLCLTLPVSKMSALDGDLGFAIMTPRASLNGRSRALSPQMQKSLRKGPQMSERILIAVDPDALAEIKAELVALRNEIRAVRMSPMPEWVTAHEYAEQVGVTRRTVMNWIAAGQIESSRHGATVLVRSRPSDRSRGRGRG